MRGFLLVVLLVLSGCAHVATTGAPWTEDFPRYEPSALPVVPVSAPPAVGIREGDLAPFDGVLFSPEEIDEVQTAAEQRDILVDALDLAYRGRADDRAAAEVVLAAREEQLRQARAAQGRWFVAGAGVGGGAVLALVLAVVLAR